MSEALEIKEPKAVKSRTYIRYWQAEGESIKTSKRIKDAHGQAVEQGKWRGGHPPYGYRTVSKGTLNGKGRPIFDVEIDSEAAEVVRTIFRLYREHYAFKGIAKYLNDNEIPTTTGALWSWTQIEDILHNKLYIGIYELGKKPKDKSSFSGNAALGNHFRRGILRGARAD